jgi:hypothetical protein
MNCLLSWLSIVIDDGDEDDDEKDPEDEDEADTRLSGE